MERDKSFLKNINLAREIYEILRVKKKKIASSESCTGGLLATFLTESPGSSLIYQGGISCYSNLAKSKILSVPMITIQTVGAVSEEVAGLLAKNVRLLLDADFGLGITGIAGPEGGTLQKPVGTVWCAISHARFEKVWCLRLNGTRSEIRMQTVECVLEELLKFLKRDEM